MKTNTNTEALLSASCFLQTLQGGSLWTLLPTLLNASTNASRYGTLIGIASAIGLLLSFLMGRGSDMYLGRYWTYRFAIALSSLCPLLVAAGVIYDSDQLLLLGTLFSRVRASRV